MLRGFFWGQPVGAAFKCGALRQGDASLADDLLVRVVGRCRACNGALGLHVIHKALGVEQVGVDVAACGVDGLERG